MTIAETLDRAAHEVGVNFIGGYSALVNKAMTASMNFDKICTQGSVAYKQDMQLGKCRFNKDRNRYECG